MKKPTTTIYRLMNETGRGPCYYESYATFDNAYEVDRRNPADRNKDQPTPLESELYPANLDCFACPSLAALRAWFSVEVIDYYADLGYEVYVLVLPVECTDTGKFGKQCIFNVGDILSVEKLVKVAC